MKSNKSRTTLNTPISKYHSSNRCNFLFADGRRCRMLRHHTSGELCLFHNRELLQLQSAAEIGAELLDLGGNFQNPIAINFVLGKLFAHVATGRMHRRDASTLAYIAQLLLQTLDQKRYDLARDRYDYRGWTQAVDAKYGRPKPKRITRTKPSPPDSPASSGAAGLHSQPANNSATPPNSLGTPTPLDPAGSAGCISRLASSPSPSHDAHANHLPSQPPHL